MDIELLANKINLNSELKNKVLSLVEGTGLSLFLYVKKQITIILNLFSLKMI